MCLSEFIRYIYSFSKHAKDVDSSTQAMLQLR